MFEGGTEGWASEDAEKVGIIGNGDGLIDSASAGTEDSIWLSESDRPDKELDSKGLVVFKGLSVRSL